MTLNIDQIYNDLLGRDPADEGRDHWSGDYNRAIESGTSHDDAVAAIEDNIRRSIEYEQRASETGFTCEAAITDDTSEGSIRGWREESGSLHQDAESGVTAPLSSREPTSTAEYNPQMLDYDWASTEAATWYDGYDSTNPGSFIDLSQVSGSQHTAALNAITETIVGLFEQRGITRDEAEAMPEFHNIIEAAVEGGPDATRDALQAAAQTMTSAEDRGDLWGATEDIGGDPNRGRSYLEQVMSGDITGASIEDLYTEGFLREGQEEGIGYWQGELDRGNMNIQQIAQSFLQSEEAQLQDAYHEHYGRTVRDEGIDYWIRGTGGDDGQSGGGGVQSFLDSLSEQHETGIRYWGAQELGQVSADEYRSDQYFTDMESDQVLDWVQSIRDGEMTIDDVRHAITTRAEVMDTYSDYESDEWDGPQTEGGPDARPTGMGAFASLNQIQEFVDSGMTIEELQTQLGAQTWPLLTHEPFREAGSVETHDWWDNYYSTWPDAPGNPNRPDDDTDTDTDDPGSGIDIPTYEAPTQLDVTRDSVEYMPNFVSDVQDTSSYQRAEDRFDTSISNVNETPKTIQQPQVGERLMNKSAQGVRRTRSDLATSGVQKGTQQFNRMQINSLNL